MNMIHIPVILAGKLYNLKFYLMISIAQQE